MKTGKVSKYSNGIGKILCEGNIYNFNLTVVNSTNGEPENDREVEFDFDAYGNVKTISNKEVKKAPTPIKKENSSNKTKDTKVFLTEEK
jgi:hypothetical protein